MTNKKLIEKVRKICEKTYRKDGWSWEYHIVPVVNYSKSLAKKLKADEEIVEISALLHDITRVTGDKENHHNSSPIKAEKILKKLRYLQEKIDAVKHCINAHRGSQNIKRETIEAECVASADAMAHFDNIPILLYVAFVKKRMEPEEGKEWIKEKLERSWKKLMPEAKQIIKPKYDAIKLILE